MEITLTLFPWTHQTKHCHFAQNYQTTSTVIRRGVRSRMFQACLHKLCVSSSFCSVLGFLACRLRQPSRPLTRSAGLPFAFKCGIPPLSLLYLSHHRHARHWQVKKCEKIYFHRSRHLMSNASQGLYILPFGQDKVQSRLEENRAVQALVCIFVFPWCKYD